MNAYDLRGLGSGQYNVELQRNGLTLDTRQLGAGAYLVELNGSNGVLATERLIVQP